MALYKRGDVWWYKFKFSGQTIRESTKSGSISVAREIERERRNQLALSAGGVKKQAKPVLFPTAAKEWFSEKAGLAPRTQLGYEQRLVPVVVAFRQRLVADISAADVLGYRKQRLEAGAAGRTINYEVGCIRGVLKRSGHWGPIADKIKGLRENHDVGRAILPEDETRLLEACSHSLAPALLPLFIFSRDTGLRSQETKALRRRDLHLVYEDGVIARGEVVVPKSKTEAGTGRSVPFTPDVCAALTVWLARFPKAGPETFVFPRHAVRMLDGGKDAVMVNPALSKPMQSWQRAWRTALKLAGVHYRWHDLRHTFITRLAENPMVSEQTIRALAGHVSKQMLERYSHIRVRAKQEAIASLSTRSSKIVEIESEGAQKWAQSGTDSPSSKLVTH